MLVTLNLISAFDILFLAHFVGDFLFQTQWMAFNKQLRPFPLVVHCSVYTLVIFGFSYFFLEQPLSIWGIVLVFVGHVILDQGAFVRFWHRHITQCTAENSGWLKIVHDQIYHLLILYAALYV